MKKLICAADITAAVAAGNKVIYLDKNTLVTPSARDMASEAGIELCDEPSVSTADSAATLDSELIYRSLCSLIKSNGAEEILSVLAQTLNVPYISEGDEDGRIKLIRGNTARYELIDTGNQSNKVHCCELVGAKGGSSKNSGFMTIEDSSFRWDTSCEEVFYIIEGTLDVECNGKNYSAVSGDVLSFKKATHLNFSSHGKVKIFYSTK